jgi:23S rRNA pseudouridine2604 synthase
VATLKLNKNKPAATVETDRAPLRGRHTPRKQQTLGQAQAERAARQQRRDESAPPPRAERAPRRDAAAPARRAPTATPRTGPTGPARPAPRRPPAPVAPPMREAAPRARSAPRPPAPTLAAKDANAEGERLSKRMTALGLASRREADEWIAAGLVRVDGRVAVLGQRVGPDVRITVDQVAHKQQALRVTVLLNKPVGYVSGQAEDGHQPAVVLVTPANRWAGDRSGIVFSPAHLRSLAPAGRLDIDSVGLLVLTQDGRIAKALVGSHEARVEKEYLVRVAFPNGPLDERGLNLLRHGLELDGEALQPAKVSWQNEDQLRFVLREGKKRQIRRMCEAVGLQVVGLKRVRIGSVPLGALPPGQWRYLGQAEKF